MKKALFLLLPCFLLLQNCDDDPIEPEEEELETIDLNAYHISFNLEGENKSLVPDGVSVGDLVTLSGGINVVGEPEDGFVLGRGSGCESLDWFMKIENNFDFTNGEFADDYSGAIASKFAVGNYNYVSDELETGIIFFFNGGDEGSFRTNTGDQTESLFTISEIISIGSYVENDVTIKGTFHCTLYDDSLNAYDLTEGTYYLRFEV